jgi:hypothetical protein
VDVYRALTLNLARIAGNEVARVLEIKTIRN